MRKLVLFFSLALAACGGSRDAPAVIGAGECRNDGLERFVGQPASSELGTDMLAASGARTLQWVGHDSAVTMDFRSDRLRVSLLRDNRVESARCG